jgi:hypothetical protein
MEQLHQAATLKKKRKWEEATILSILILKTTERGRSTKVLASEERKRKSRKLE